MQDAKGLSGVTGIQGERGPEGYYGTQGLVGEKCDRGERRERGAIGEKGIQGDTSDVLNVLAGHLPIQPEPQCGENICFVKYHLSEDRSSIVESSGGVQTLRNVSAYHKPAWNFDAKLVNGQGHIRANVQKAPAHGHFLEMKNSVYHCHYDLVDNKVNAIYIVYKITTYYTITSSPVEWTIIIMVYASSRMQSQ